MIKPADTSNRLGGLPTLCSCLNCQHCKEAEILNLHVWIVLHCKQIQSKHLKTSLQEQNTLKDIADVLEFWNQSWKKKKIKKKNKNVHN